MSPRRKEDNEKIQDASRNKILTSAFELFARKGYVTTTIANIAKEAGISKGLIYHYFESKEAILKGLFGMLMKEGDRMMNQNKNAPPSEFIKGVIHYSFDFLIRQPKVNRLLILLALQPEIVKDISEEIDKAKKEWLGGLEKMFKELGYKNPEAEAYMLAATFDGVGLGYMTLGEDYPIEKVRKLILKKYDVK